MVAPTKTVLKVLIISSLVLVTTPTTNGLPSLQSGSSHSSFGLLLNLLIGLAICILLVVAIVPTTQRPCVVKVTGESVLIDNCPNAAEIMEKINLAPWNGVKFPKD